MSLGKVLKKVGAGFLVTLIESANEKLSIEYNIVACTTVFFLKIFFVNLAFSLFLKNLPFGVGGWDLMLFFRRYKRCLFGIYEFYRLHLTSGGQLHTPA